MGKDINVTSFDEMAKSAQKLQTISNNYQEIANTLMEHARTMGAAWESAGNQAFVEQINGFSAELKEMADKLSLAGKTLDQQRANYVARQDDNITQVKKLEN